MVVVKVPIWSVTASVTGSIPLLALPKVKLDRSAKSSLFGLCSKSISSLALKARKGMHADGGTMATAMGLFPTGIGFPTTRLLAVSITETVLDVCIRDIDMFPIRGDGDTCGASTHTRPWPSRRGFVGRVDHRNISRDRIRDIDVFPVRGDGDPLGAFPTVMTVGTTVLVAVSIT